MENSYLSRAEFAALRDAKIHNTDNAIPANHVVSGFITMDYTSLVHVLERQTNQASGSQCQSVLLWEGDYLARVEGKPRTTGADR